MDFELEPMDPRFGQDERDSQDPGSYQGTERRQMPRRCLADRRSMLRFEPGRQDRRSGKDRRAAGQDSWSSLYNL